MSYADPKRRYVTFLAGDLVFLKVSQMKWVMRFCKKGKLAPRYFGPFESWSRVSEVAYRLVLLSKLSRINPVFHMLMLRKYISNPSHVLQSQAVELSENLTYEQYPVEIVNRQVRQLRIKDIMMVKVLWSNHTTDDCTWETKAMMWVVYPYLFQFWFVPPLFIKFEDEFL